MPSLRLNDVQAQLRLHFSGRRLGHGVVEASSEALGSAEGEQTRQRWDTAFLTKDVLPRAVARSGRDGVRVLARTRRWSSLGWSTAAVWMMDALGSKSAVSVVPDFFFCFRFLR